MSVKTYKHGAAGTRSELVAISALLEGVIPRLPLDLRTDGKCYPESDEDHVGVILENAIDHVSEAIHALNQYLEP